MSVRGTTYARHMRRVIIREGAQEGERIWCAWDDCDKHGYDAHRVRINEAKPGFPAKYINYVFCSNRHMEFWKNSHRQFGRLPAGSRSSIL